MLKQRLWVWLPPDGDTRARDLQESWGARTGRIEFLIRPVHLVLAPEARPLGPLTAGEWVLDREGLFLLIHEGIDLVGRLRLAEQWRGLVPELALGPPPPWCWRRGRLAWMDEEVDPEAGQWNWTLDQVSGWKGADPKA